MSQAVILVVDDDPELTKLVTAVVEESGFDVLGATSGPQALELLRDHPVDVVLTDLVMPEMDGLALLREVRTSYPDLPVVMMTAHSSVANAVAAMKAGADDFVVKPLDASALLFSLDKCVRSSQHVDATSGRVAVPGDMIGESPVMERVFELIKKASQSSATVLIRGESGTGKELVARAIHRLSPRKDAPMLKLHCAALPDNLLESELFGYERGAFTGATARKPGRVDLANGGTLFLDEIGDVTPAVQVKLLRLLQDREYERLGGTETLKADVRFVAATHRPLEELVVAGTFREDLFYRLNVVPIVLPPLRERRDDIPLLVRKCGASVAAANGKPQLRFDDDAVELMRQYDWPGNVRQLLNLLERLVVLGDGDRVTRAEVARDLAGAAALANKPAATSSPERELATLYTRPATDEEAIAAAIAKAHGNRTVAARLLGVSRRTLYNRLEALGMSNRGSG